MRIIYTYRSLLLVGTLAAVTSSQAFSGLELYGLIYAGVESECERYTEREPHPGGQEAFTIRACLPWQRNARTRIKVETAVDEKILMPVEKRAVIHENGEPLKAHIQVYALEEIVAEKLRAIHQHAQRLQQRGWSRSRARDYYDLCVVLLHQRVASSRLSVLLAPPSPEKCLERWVECEEHDENNERDRRVHR